MSFLITNKGQGLAAYLERTGHADTLEAAFELAASMAITFACNVEIYDEYPEEEGSMVKVARIEWLDEVVAEGTRSRWEHSDPPHA